MMRWYVVDIFGTCVCALVEYCNTSHSHYDNLSNREMEFAARQVKDTTPSPSKTDSATTASYRVVTSNKRK